MTGSAGIANIPYDSPHPQMRDGQNRHSFAWFYQQLSPLAKAQLNAWMPWDISQGKQTNQA
jgi:hypothetical protein